MAKTLRRRSGTRRKTRKQMSKKCKVCKMRGGCACLGGGIMSKVCSCKMCKKWFKNPFNMKGG